MDAAEQRTAAKQHGFEQMKTTTLKAVQQFAQATPDAIAIEGDEIHLSYSALLSEVESVNRYFQSRGFNCIALLMDNSPAWVVFDLAAQMAAITLVPLPPFFTSNQIQHSLADAGAEVLISDQTAPLSALLPHARPRPIPKVAGQSCWQVTLPTASHNRPMLHNIAKVTYTSGTTGTPKGVCLTQTAMDSVANSLKRAIGITAHERHLVLLPLAVLLENVGGIYTPLLAGGRCLIPKLSRAGIMGATELNAGKMIDAIRHAEANTIILLPQMLQALTHEMQRGAPLPEKLRFIAVGGAPVSQRLLNEATSQGLPVYEGYGLSECGSVVAVNTPERHRPGSVGKVLPHIAIKFSDEGEILLAGTLFKGYLNHSPRSDEWYPSGDLGHLDSDGYLYLTGRKKSCFITSFGRNVAPEWVEKELTQHPAINQAVVFGEARPYNIAIIVPHSTDNRSLKRIEAAISEANQQLPDYAQVSDWLFADEPFTIANQQLTATGRARREQIWQHYNEHIDQRYHQHGATAERSQHAIL